MRRPNPVLGGDRLDPARRCIAPLGMAPEVDRARLGPVDVARPEQADVAVPEAPPARDALQGHLDRPVGEQFVTQAALQAPVRRGLLIQLGGVVVDPAQLHRRVPGLEEDLPGLRRPVVDVLEVQPGVGRHEQVLATPRMPEGGQAAVPGAMPGQDAVVDGPVVHDDRLDLAPAEHDVGLLGNGVTDRGIRERRPAGLLGRDGPVAREEDRRDDARAYHIP